MTMMTTDDFLDFIETLGKDAELYNGYCDESKEKSITVYFRSNAAAKDYRGFDDPSTQLLPITLLITYTDNNAIAQRFAIDLWQQLKYTYHTQGSYNFHIIPKDNLLPVSLSKNEAGFFQYAIDFNIFYSERS